MGRASLLDQMIIFSIEIEKNVSAFFCFSVRSYLSVSIANVTATAKRLPSRTAQTVVGGLKCQRDRSC